MSSVRSVLVTRPSMRFRPSGVVDTSNLNEFNDSRMRHLPAASVSSKRGQTVGRFRVAAVTVTVTVAVARDLPY